MELLRVDLRTVAWESCARLLTDEERARGERYVRAADRARFVVGRATARRALGRLLGVAPPAVPIVTDTNGRPTVPGSEWAFSVSHSGDAVLVALARTAIGVDVEAIERDLDVETLATAVLTGSERASFAHVAIERRATALLRAWTRKEACLKALGVGLLVEPTSFAVPDGPLPHARVVEVLGTALELRDVDVGHGYVAALAISARAPTRAGS